MPSSPQNDEGFSTFIKRENFELQEGRRYASPQPKVLYNWFESL